VPGSSSVRVCAVPATVRCSSSSRVFRLLLVTRGSAPVTLVCHDSGARSDGGRFPAGALRAPGGPLGLVPHAPQPREVVRSGRPRGWCLGWFPRSEVFCCWSSCGAGLPVRPPLSEARPDDIAARRASQAEANGGEYLSVGGKGRRCVIDNTCCQSGAGGLYQAQSHAQTEHVCYSSEGMVGVGREAILGGSICHERGHEVARIAARVAEQMCARLHV